MNLKEIINQARLLLGQSPVQAVFGIQDDQLLQMLTILNEVGKEIARKPIKNSGWSFLREVYNFTPYVSELNVDFTAGSNTITIPTSGIKTGDRVFSSNLTGDAYVVSMTETTLILSKPAKSTLNAKVLITRAKYDLPNDYLFLIRNTYREIEGRYGYYDYVLDPIDYSRFSVNQHGLHINSFFISGRTIEFMPYPRTNSPIPIWYVSKNWVIKADNTRDDHFTSDNDESLIDGTLLADGLVWYVRASRGQDFSVEKQKYDSKLNDLAFEDGKGMNDINLRRPRCSNIPAIPLLPEGNWNYGKTE